MRPDFGEKFIIILTLLHALDDSNHTPFDCSYITASSRPNCDPHAGHVSDTLEPAAKMFRTAILRSAAVATRTAVRPMTSAAARRFAVTPVPRVASFVPKTVAWQAVRCYASGSSLDKVEVYERIKQLLSGFDKVGFGALVASPGGVSGSARSDFWVLFRSRTVTRLFWFSRPRRWMCVQDNNETNQSDFSQVNDPSNVSLDFDRQRLDSIPQPTRIPII